MMETIALYCGTSVRSVQNHINQLLKDGYISRRRRFMMSSVYRIELTKLRADAEKFDALMRARKEAWAAKTSGFDATAAAAEAASLPANPAPLPEDSAPLPANFAVYDQQILQTEPVIQPVDEPITKTSPAPTVVTPAAATPAARPLVVVKEIPEIPEDVLAAWIAVRKTKNRKILTTVELDEIREEGAKAGLSLADTIKCCVKSHWVRFEAHWIKKTPEDTVPSAEPVAPAVLEKIAAQAQRVDSPPLSLADREAMRAAIERIKSTPVKAKHKLSWAEDIIADRRAGKNISYGSLKLAMDALGMSTWQEVSCAA